MISNFNIKQISRGRKLRLVVLTLLATVALANTARADVVTDWNQIAINTAVKDIPLDGSDHVNHSY